MKYGVKAIIIMDIIKAILETFSKETVAKIDLLKQVIEDLQKDIDKQ